MYTHKVDIELVMATSKLRSYRLKCAYRNVEARSSKIPQLRTTSVRLVRVCLQHESTSSGSTWRHGGVNALKVRALATRSITPTDD